MIELYEKRGRWCAKAENKRLRKFTTREEAEQYLGIEVPSLEEENYHEPDEAQEWADFDPDC